MKKIFCYFTGSIGNIDLKLLANHIDNFKQNFLRLKNNEIRVDYVLFISVEEINETAERSLVDISYLNSIITTITMPTMPVEMTMLCTQNNCPITNILHYEFVQTYLKETGVSYDYVIKINNEIDVSFQNILNYITDNESVYVLPRVWWNQDKHNLKNNHLLIIPATKFYNCNFTNDYVKIIAEVSSDNETLDAMVVQPDRIILMLEITE